MIQTLQGTSYYWGTTKRRLCKILTFPLQSQLLTTFQFSTLDLEPWLICNLFVNLSKLTSPSLWVGENSVPHYLCGFSLNHKVLAYLIFKCYLPENSGYPILPIKYRLFISATVNRPVTWKSKLLSRVWLFVIPWTIQSMEFSRLEYWSG